ncbi:putative NADPH-dependent alpha-keto amide reductase [Nadsonia fulvescens var. elongata DSM 6958]|uniref:Putative NADPH-dependent alpha-keto amide reductase n=1 Tax=Nadsonia fulvescens var. elongata DSM 6958 TaxID=857566 RepID=A0A1E3PR25_9ASCO|nr:putative NADPH-dependent alpha-keto amide reductase [Nadsonia fulvescens var. elongata DSM 6958]
MAIPTFKLSNGVEIPAIGFGTGTKWFKRSNDNQTSDEQVDTQTVAALTTALGNGITHIDGAEVYGTEPEIGTALKEYLASPTNPSATTREQLFVTTKVLPHIKDVNKALNNSLSKLGLEYVDLYLIHSPFISEDNPEQGISLEDAWRAVERAYTQGKVRAIGVSNFTVEDLKRILAIATIKPQVHQIEFNAYLQNQTPGIVAFSQSEDILVEAYSPLAPVAQGKGGPLDQVLANLAKKYNKSVGQITLRWVYQNGILPITTSAHSERQKEALDIFSFELSQDEVDEVARVGSQKTFRQYWIPQFGHFDKASI